MSQSTQREPTLSIRLLWPLLRMLGQDSRGLRLLAEMGLRPDDLAERDLRISCRVAMRGLERAADVFEDPALGLRAGLQTDHSVLDFAEYAARSCENLGAAMEVMARLTCVMNESAESSVLVEGPLAYYRYAPTIPYPAVANDMVVATSLEFAKRNCEVYAPPLEVWVMHERPSYAAAYEELLQAPVRFGAPVNATVMRSTWLAVPMRTRNAELAAAFERKTRALVQASGETNSVTRRVRESLAVQFTTGSVQMNDTGRRLGMGIATLRRKLEEEGTSFSEILEDMRKETAVRHLRNVEPTISEVAFLLGFSTVSAFARAFKRWTGVSPTKFRETRHERGSI